MNVYKTLNASRDFMIQMVGAALFGGLQDLRECNSIGEAIVDAVAKDIAETADVDEWCDGDVEIAVIRVLKKKLHIEE